MKNKYKQYCKNIQNTIYFAIQSKVPFFFYSTNNLNPNVPLCFHTTASKLQCMCKEELSDVILKFKIYSEPQKVLEF